MKSELHLQTTAIVPWRKIISLFLLGICAAPGCIKKSKSDSSTAGEDAANMRLVPISINASKGIMSLTGDLAVTSWKVRRECAPDGNAFSEIGEELVSPVNISLKIGSRCRIALTEFSLNGQVISTIVNGSSYFGDARMIQGKPGQTFLLSNPKQLGDAADGGAGRVSSKSAECVKKPETVFSPV